MVAFVSKPILKEPKESLWGDENILYLGRVVGHTCMCNCQHFLKQTCNLVSLHVVTDPLDQLVGGAGAAPPAILGPFYSFSEF